MSHTLTESEYRVLYVVSVCSQKQTKGYISREIVPREVQICFNKKLFFSVLNEIVKTLHEKKYIETEQDGVMIHITKTGRDALRLTEITHPHYTEKSSNPIIPMRA